MVTWFLDNWITLLGGGSISGIIGWFLGGKRKQDIEIDSAEIDYAAKVRELYEDLNAKLKQENESLKSDKDEIIAEFKAEKEYFRSQIDELRTRSLEMQTQFNNMQLAYAKEVEQSQNWEKLHRELFEKYQQLEKDHEELKLKFDKLKADYEKHKKQAK